MIQPKKVMGRPKKPEAEILSQRSIRMSPEQWAKVGRIGVKSLRDLIDKWETVSVVNSPPEGTT